MLGNRARRSAKINKKKVQLNPCSNNKNCYLKPELQFYCYLALSRAKTHDNKSRLIKTTGTTKNERNELRLTL